MIASALTMRTYYDCTFRPAFHRRVSQRTVDEYWASLNLWELLTGDMPLDAIDNAAIAAFVEMLERMPGKQNEQTSPATVNKHLRHLNHLWSKAGPKGHRNRDALSLINEAPWAKCVPTITKLPRAIPLEVIDKLYQAAASDAWRALIVAAYNLGSRKEALLGLRESDLNWLDRTVRLEAKFDKRSTERLKPLNRTLVRHLNGIRKEKTTLFDVANNKQQFYRTWHQIQDAAGIRAGEHFKFHDLKRSCGTQLSKVASEWQVRYMLDHAQRDVTGQSYIDPLDDLRSVVERMPQPSSFLLEQQRSFLDDQA